MEFVVPGPSAYTALMASQETQIKNTEATLAAVKQELSQASTELTSVYKEIDVAINRLTEIKIQCRDAFTEFQNTKAATAQNIELKEEELRKIEGTKFLREKEIFSLNNSIVEAQQKILQLNDNIHKLTVNNGLLEKENVELRNKQKELVVFVNSVMDQKDDAIREMNSLQEGIKISNKELDRKLKQVAEFKNYEQERLDWYKKKDKELAVLSERIKKLFDKAGQRINLSSDGL